MVGGKKRLRKVLKATLDGKADKPTLVPGLLGAYINGIPTITVAGRPDFVWVRLRGDESARIQAFNEKVAEHFELPILVARDKDLADIWYVHGRDLRQYESWEGAAYGPPHGSSHSFAGAPYTGSDIVWTNKRQYMPMLPRPVASGSMGIWIHSDFYYFDGRYHFWPGSGTGDIFSALRPTGSLNSRYVTVYIDENGNPAGLVGAEFETIYAGDPATYISLPTSDQGVPVAAVLLQTGTQWIGWGEIYDLRNPNAPLWPTGSFITVFDEGAYRGFVNGINFVGDNVEVVVSGSYAHVMVSGTAGGNGGVDQIGIYALDDGVPRCSGSWVDFGNRLDVSCSGTVIRVDATASDLAGDKVVVTQPSPLNTATGTYWLVPDEIFRTGSLGLAVNGLVQTPTIDYAEQYPGSGTFQFISEGPPTGSFLTVWYGVTIT